ncbi:MAG: monovalent cation/H(+) antiporter subunit G [Lachnospiraceae bacterium]
MLILEWLRFLIGTIFLGLGLITFLMEVFGVYHFKYVLNRMHVAAIGDTLGILLALLGLMIMNGFNYTSMKMLLIITFLWFASPVSSHLLARLEVTTNGELEKYCEVQK